MNVDPHRNRTVKDEAVRQTYQKSLPTPQYLDTHAAASYLGINRKMLENLRLRGIGPDFLKIGRLVRYRTADLDRWAEQFMVRGAEE